MNFPRWTDPLSVQYDSQRHTVKWWVIFLSHVPWKTSRRFILSQCTPPIRNVSQCYRRYQYLGLQFLGADLYKMLNDCASWTGEKRAAGVNKTRSGMARLARKTKRYKQHGLNTKQKSVKIKLAQLSQPPRAWWSLSIVQIYYTTMENNNLYSVTMIRTCS